jgi:predicted DNA-binding antitoxin AbrB/MazE fold protein
VIRRASSLAKWGAAAVRRDRPADEGLGDDRARRLGKRPRPFRLDRPCDRIRGHAAGQVASSAQFSVDFHQLLSRGTIGGCDRFGLRSEINAMSLEVEATYEDGVLKPSQPLPLREHERVVISVKPMVSRIRQAAGLIRWTGDPAVLKQIAEDPDCGVSESP